MIQAFFFGRAIGFSAYVPTSIASGSGVCEEESTSFNVIQQVEDEAGWNPYRSSLKKSISISFNCEPKLLRTTFHFMI